MQGRTCNPAQGWYLLGGSSYSFKGQPQSIHDHLARRSGIVPAVSSSLVHKELEFGADILCVGRAHEYCLHTKYEHQILTGIFDILEMLFLFGIQNHFREWTETVL